MDILAASLVSSGPSCLYWLTFAGLYFELAGGFLLAVEAIGPDHLIGAGAFLKRHRIAGFGCLVVATAAIIVFTKLIPAFRLTEALILIVTLGLLFDFAPALFEMAVKRFRKGTAGIIGFGLFAVGFSIQSYVALVQLR